MSEAAQKQTEGHHLEGDFDPTYRYTWTSQKTIVIECSEYEVDDDGEVYYPSISVYVANGLEDLKAFYIIEERKFKTNDELWAAIRQHVNREISRGHRLVLSSP